MAERFKALVSKISWRESVSRVRIPVSPPPHQLSIGLLGLYNYWMWDLLEILWNIFVAIFFINIFVAWVFKDGSKIDFETFLFIQAIVIIPLIVIFVGWYMWVYIGSLWPILYGLFVMHSVFLATENSERWFTLHYFKTRKSVKMGFSEDQKVNLVSTPLHTLWSEVDGKYISWWKRISEWVKPIDDRENKQNYTPTQKHKVKLNS